MSGFPGPAVGRREDVSTRQFLDNLADTVVAGDRTDGRQSVVETRRPAGHVTPEQLREEPDETLHVLEGARTAHTGDTTRQATAGGSGVLSRGAEHALVADEPSVVPVSTTPAGGDEFVAAAGEPIDDETVPSPPPSEAAIQRVRDVPGTESRPSDPRRAISNAGHGLHS